MYSEQCKFEVMLFGILTSARDATSFSLLSNNPQTFSEVWQDDVIAVSEVCLKPTDFREPWKLPKRSRYQYPITSRGDWKVATFELNTLASPNSGTYTNTNSFHLDLLCFFIANPLLASSNSQSLRKKLSGSWWTRQLHIFFQRMFAVFNIAEADLIPRRSTSIIPSRIIWRAFSNLNSIKERNWFDLHSLWI